MNSRRIRRAVASAPGKAILIGEHAAVFGRPALVAGVGLRLTSTLERCSDTQGVQFDLADLGVREERAWETLLEEARDAREGWEAWRDRRSDLPEVARNEQAGRVVRLALAESELALRRDAGMDPSASGPSLLGRDGGLKLSVTSTLPVGAGLGSSAAVAVSVVAAAAAMDGRRVEPNWIERVSGETERRQHGSPSGVDVAAVLYGGVLRVSRSEGALACEILDLPPGSLASLQLLDSGSPPESTGKVVAAVRSRHESDRDAVETCFDQLEDACESLLVGLREGTLRAECLRAAHRALDDLGVVPAAVSERIADLERAGGAAKISGAGSLTGPGAGLILAAFPQEVARPPWKRLHADLGAPGLEVRVD